MNLNSFYLQLHKVIINNKICVIFRIGGPLIRAADNILIGITSFVRLGEHKANTNLPVDIQVFTDLHHHFDWIAAKTGINLPKCSGFFHNVKSWITTWYKKIL